MHCRSDSSWTATLNRYRDLVVEPRMALRGEIESRQKLLEEYREEIEATVKRIAVVEKSSSLVQFLIDDLSKKGIAEMEAMLTAAVSAAFVDRDYKISIEVDDRGKDKKAEILLDKAGKTSELDCNGDGLSGILSFITRQFYIVRFDKARIIVMDEPMKELSPRFLEGVAKFIQTLIQELGFVVIVITHDRSQFIPVADRVYWVEDGGILKEVTGEVPEAELE